ncbi:MAG: polysaccharide biosynthesis C-terminal domain-containing protein [Fimbriiglobus sp.]|nr:polysaccharide biosynthesis C-terminal domain-containing protein [Fimbriiglobus sp.]
MPASRSRFLLGAVANWLAFAATLAVAFLLTPFLLGHLGKPRYDVWCIAEAVLAYFTLLDMGVAACLVRAVAGRHASADADGLNRMASSCLALFVAAGGVALAVGVPVLLAMSGTLSEKADGDPGVLPFLLLMLANVAAGLPLSVLPSILDGLEQYAAKSLVKLLALAARTGGMVYAVTTFGGLFPIAVVYTVVTALEHLALALLCRKFLPILRFNWRLIDRATLKQVKTYSVDAFLAMLAGRITVQTGTVLIGLLLPSGQATFFATASRLVEYAKSLLRTVTATLTPNVSAMEAKGDHAGVRRLFLNATRWMLYLALPIQIGLMLFGKPFLSRWVGAEFVEGSFPAVVLLGTTLAVGVAQSAASRILYGLGRLRWFARAALGEALLNLLLTAILIQPLGVTGVAVAVAVPNLLFCAVVIGLTAKELGVSAGDYFRVWWKPLLANAVPLAVWLAIGGPAPDYGAIAAAVAAGLLPYAAAVGLLERGRALLARGRRVVPRQGSGHVVMPSPGP